ncbi:MAG: hypothetical protein MOB07_27360 [Acidobacteria bacterium]|nr:hypothetical protein [Acidobacteriota bacterium]
MHSAKRLISFLLCALLAAPIVTAQEPTRSQQPNNPISQDVLIIIQQQQVRFTAQKAVAEMQLKVFDQTGEMVYDSGAIVEPELNWLLQDANGNTVKSGMYAYQLSIKEAGDETARVRRGHFIVDRAQDRDGTDKLWVTSQNSNGIGTELTVARDENATIAGTTTGKRALGQRDDSTNRGSGERGVEAEAGNKTTDAKTASAAVAVGTPGNIAKFTSATDLGNSVMTELNRNIGVGTIFPTVRFHVFGSADTGGTALFEPNPGKGQFHSHVHWGPTGDWYIRSAAAAGKVVLQDTGGVVGIGTASPESPLHVYSPVSNHVTVQTAGGTNAWAQFRMKSTNQTWAMGTSQNFNGDQFYLFDVTRNLIRMGIQPNGGEISFPSPVSNHVVVQTSGGTNAWAQFRMRSTNQQWAIGTSQDFNGDQFYLFDVTRNLIRMGVQPNGGAITFPLGNVGIGTNNPAFNLHIHGSGFVEAAVQSINERAMLSLNSTIGGINRVWTLESGLWGIPGLFGIFDRTTGRAGLTIDTNGTVGVNVLQITGGADFAENFDVNVATTTSETLAKVEPGMVVSIDPANPGKLALSAQSYDRRVAGIISGAGGVKPGMMMSQTGTLADGQHPVALSGRVYCWVDATHGAIEPGDLLTTSSTAGHAMKVTDQAKAQGAIIGKAMTGLKDGKGLVLVLVTLQ